MIALRYFYLKGYKNKGIISTEGDDHDLPMVIEYLKEQKLTIAQLREDLLKERNTNTKLTAKVEELANMIRSISESYSNDLQILKEETKSFRNGVEAKIELQASAIDELRFQVQSIRNKMESKRLNSDTPSASPARTGNNKSGEHHLSPSKKIIFQNSSQDSLSSAGSNPCLMSRSCLSSQRAEYVWRINAFTKKLKRIQSNTYDEPSRSEPFTTGPNGYRLSMWAYLNGRGKGLNKCLAVYVRIMAGEYDPILQWPVKPCYTFQLISQAQEPNKRLDLVRVRDLSIKHNGIMKPQKDDKSIIVGFDDFIVHEDIEKKEYLVDDSLFIKCIVEFM